MATESIPGQYRTSLPVRGSSKRNSFGLCSLCNDLSKVTVPVTFNEPLSFLQRIAEYMEYAKLLKLAAAEQTPLGRIQYVTAFAVSTFSSSWKRFGKPFNPLLGETYELQREDFRIICEQVSHHPPVSAFHADSEDFIFHGSIHPKLRLNCNSLEINPEGVNTVIFPKWKEAYTWRNMMCVLHNALIGPCWMEHTGSLHIQPSGASILKATLNFMDDGSWNGKDLYRVEGYVEEENKKVSYLYGKWTERLRACEPSTYEDTVEKTKRESKSPQGSPGSKNVLAKLHSLKVGAFKPSHQDAIDKPSTNVEGEETSVLEEIPGSTTLWEACPRPANSSEYYEFTTFAMSLNEMQPSIKKTLCPTDSRLRPDIRKLEMGDQDGAASEKRRLEEKQRHSRKARKQGKLPKWEPRWFKFTTNPHTSENDWLYQGGYWDRNFSTVEDIF